jgi:hypothetical protein
LSAINTVSHADYGGIATHPYRPSPEDFRQPDPARQEGLWMIPLTAGVMASGGSHLTRYLRARWSSVGPVPRGYGTLRLWEPPQLVQPAIAKTLENLDSRYLAFAVRSDVLLNPWWSRNCRYNLKALFEHAAQGTFIWTTPAHAVSLLNASPAVVNGLSSGEDSA